jgi:hydrogenase maturation protein HypF
VTVDAILADVMAGISLPRISTRFHLSLTEMIVAVAKKVALERVVLSGGCFQNRFLAEVTVRRLEAEGFRPYWHQRVPPNDGGIALGQLAIAMNGTQREE